MNEALFNKRVGDTLLRIEDAIEASGADIEFETAADILTLEFTNKTKIIINRQGAVRQLWVAAKSGGFHYNYDADGERWVNDQSGTELFAELSRLASEQAGEPVDLT
jgi:CyaY protein